MTDCIHHWMINERGTRGRCKKCGRVVVYPDHLTPAQYRASRKQANLEVRAARDGGKCKAGMSPAGGTGRPGEVTAAK